MIVAQKFQTGFDQPKLCAMYEDKKLGGIECVQTLSRLNRVYPGKLESGTFVLDFVNEPAEVLEAFQDYFQTAELTNVSDPNLLWELYDKLRDSGIFLWSEVTLFSEVFFTKSKSQAAISNVCKPAVERWQNRYEQAHKAHVKAKDLFARAKKSGDAVLIANAEGEMKAAKQELDALGTLKGDLAVFTRQYEFLSQIVDYDSTDLEKLSLFARHLAPLLREKTPEQDPIDLSSVELSHYRLAKIRQQDLLLVADAATGLGPASAYGTRKARDVKEEWLSQIITRLNELFVTDGLSDKDLVNYAYTLRDKLSENQAVMKQIENNSPEQAMLGDFATALDDAVMESSEVHQNLMNQVLTNKETAAGLGRLVFDMLLGMKKGLGVERHSSVPPSR
jgi:type I restriction enzyme R subunit